MPEIVKNIKILLEDMTSDELVSGLFLHELLDANLFKMAAKQHSLSQSG